MRRPKFRALILPEALAIFARIAIGGTHGRNFIKAMPWPFRLPSHVLMRP